MNKARCALIILCIFLLCAVGAAAETVSFDKAAISKLDGYAVVEKNQAWCFSQTYYASSVMDSKGQSTAVHIAIGL